MYRCRVRRPRGSRLSRAELGPEPAEQPVLEFPSRQQRLQRRHVGLLVGVPAKGQRRRGARPESPPPSSRIALTPAAGVSKNIGVQGASLAPRDPRGFFCTIWRVTPEKRPTTCPRYRASCGRRLNVVFTFIKITLLIDFNTHKFFIASKCNRQQGCATSSQGGFP